MENKVWVIELLDLETGRWLPLPYQPVYPLGQAGSAIMSLSRMRRHFPKGTLRVRKYVDCGDEQQYDEVPF